MWIKGLILSAVIVLGTAASAQTGAPMPIHPDSLKWTSPPNVQGLRSAWVVGGEKQAGAYILRVKLAKGARLNPHSHPDTRHTTVLSGTIRVGFGDRFDESAMVSIPAGSVLVVPANTPHFVWSRDGDAEYQESGVGPTGTVFKSQ